MGSESDYYKDLYFDIAAILSVENHEKDSVGSGLGRGRWGGTPRARPFFCAAPHYERRGIGKGKSLVHTSRRRPSVAGAGEALLATCPSRRENTMRLTINGKSHEVDVDPTTPLLWVIREQVGLTGTKYGCGVAQCGACTVHVNGLPVRSCQLPVSAAGGARITTIEGLASGKTLHKVQKAWINNDVPQCGYCQSGMIMAVAALLKTNPKPSDADIDSAITNI